VPKLSFIDTKVQELESDNIMKHRYYIGNVDKILGKYPTFKDMSRLSKLTESLYDEGWLMKK